MWPEGSGEHSPGFTLGCGCIGRGPEWAPSDEAPTNHVWKCRGPFQGLSILGCVSQGKPWAFLARWAKARRADPICSRASTREHAQKRRESAPAPRVTRLRARKEAPATRVKRARHAFHAMVFPRPEALRPAPSSRSQKRGLAAPVTTAAFRGYPVRRTKQWIYAPPDPQAVCHGLSVQGAVRFLRLSATVDIVSCELSADLIWRHIYGNHSVNYTDFIGSRCAAYLALQFRLGLLPDRRLGPSFHYPPSPCLDGEDLACAEVKTGWHLVDLRDSRLLG